VFIIFLMIGGLQLVHDIWGLLGFGWMSEVGLRKPTTKSSQICTTSTKGVVSLRSSLSIWNGIVPGCAQQCSCIKPCLSSSILKKKFDELLVNVFFCCSFFLAQISARSIEREVYLDLVDVCVCVCRFWNSGISIEPVWRSRAWFKWTN
jgi:hypothetical protein